MFTATIGAYNSRTKRVSNLQPRIWPGGKTKQRQEVDSTVGPGQRHASKKADKFEDPTKELMEEILGTK